MIQATLFRVVLLSGIGLALAGCKGGDFSTSRAGFKANYLVARVALEGGQYDKAARQFGSLLRTAGPLEPRLRLEYAHALLRAGKYAKAADEARRVSMELSGTGRSAALAVLGTAEHETARAAILKGKTGLETINRMKAAKAALTEMLANNPELDPTGGMAMRLQQIETELVTVL
ncbi:hypothetical protein [Psychromarinibacter sp. S121]|uniref:hypothetical protein n=1 Tax=Psychromarinibacter sp. S121 TaxID=3415127 RepID=UPI003C7E8BDC